MLIVVCGEDNVASREYFNSLIRKYRVKDYIPKTIVYDELKLLIKEISQSLDLFGLKQLYYIENLSKKLGKKKYDDSTSLLKKIDQNKRIVLIDWEDHLSKREIKTGKIGIIKEFKPQTNVFKLLDACYPHNLASFRHTLELIANPKTEMFIYTMLTRHIKSLLLAKEGETFANLATWQRQRIFVQSKRWNKEKLISFYQKLLGIDISLKTGKNIFGLKNSIELLSCYYIS